MQGYQQQPQYAPGSYAARPQLHDGVRQFMNGVYGWMAAGLAVTAAAAYGMAQWAGQSIENFNSYMSMRLILTFVVMGLAWFGTPRLLRMSKATAALAFFGFSTLMGVWLGWVPMMYAPSSIQSVFVATVAMFAGMAFFGYVTKKDLSGVGQFMVMAILGCVIGSLINAFLIQSGGMGMIISAVVAVASAALVAYDTQAIKQVYLKQGGAGGLAVFGALLLYINFINLFLSLLHLFGSRD